MRADAISAYLTTAGTLIAVAAVALLSLLPSFKLPGLLLVVLTGVLFWSPAVVGKAARERRLWLHSALDLPILLLLVQLGISVWASALPNQSWVSASQLLAGVVACYAVINWTRERARLVWTVLALVAVGLGLALVAPFAVDWFREQKTFLPPSLYRFFPLLLPDSIHPNVMAGALVTLIPLSLALALSGRLARGLRLALLVVFLIQLFVLILTKSRGGYIALGVGLWLTLWLSGRRRWALGLSVVAVVLLAWLLLRSPAATTAGVAASGSALDASTWAFRQQVWHAALQVIGDFPFTGAGIGTFNDVAALLYGFYSPANPGAHNLFLQVGVDLGIPGLIAFLAIWLVALWSALQAYRLSDRSGEPPLRAVATGTLAGLFATLVHGLVDSHTWGSKGAFIPWLLIGLAVALHSVALAGRNGRVAEPKVLAP